MSTKIGILKIHFAASVKLLFSYICMDLKALIPIARSITPSHQGFDLTAYTSLVYYITNIQKEESNISVYDYMILVYSLQSKLPPLIKSVSKRKTIPETIISIKLTAYNEILITLLNDISPKYLE